MTCKDICKDLEEALNANPTSSELKAKKPKRKATKPHSPSPANTTPPTSPIVMPMDDSSDDDDPVGDAVSLICFNSRKYANIKNIRENEYHTVDYTDTSDVRRVTKINRKSISMKFLIRLTNDRFDWARRDDFENVLVEGKLAINLFLTLFYP